MKVRFIACGALLCATIQACGLGSSEQRSPVATVRHFLDMMDRSATDEGALEDAYRLLDASARKALDERAERASTLAGRRYAGWQMLSQGRFRLRFAPAAPGGLRERVQGDRALVTVSGAKGQRAEVLLVREQGQWQIALPIPPMRSETRRIAPSPGQG